VLADEFDYLRRTLDRFETGHEEYLKSVQMRRRLERQLTKLDRSLSSLQRAHSGALALQLHGNVAIRIEPSRLVKQLGEQRVQLSNQITAMLRQEDLLREEVTRLNSRVHDFLEKKSVQ
jgi:chaperonin cofactor prefoldin